MQNPVSINNGVALDPAIRAITATKAWASAVATNARAIPCGRKRAMIRASS